MVFMSFMPCITVQGMKRCCGVAMDRKMAELGSRLAKTANYQTPHSLIESPQLDKPDSSERPLSNTELLRKPWQCSDAFLFESQDQGGGVAVRASTPEKPIVARGSCALDD